jgi:hypothetical protein
MAKKKTSCPIRKHLKWIISGVIVVVLVVAVVIGMNTGLFDSTQENMQTNLLLDAEAPADETEPEVMPEPIGGADVYVASIDLDKATNSFAAQICNNEEGAKIAGQPIEVTFVANGISSPAGIVVPEPSKCTMLYSSKLTLFDLSSKNYVNVQVGVTMVDGDINVANNSLTQEIQVP